MAKFAVITGFLGEMRDRFSIYNTKRTPGEKFEAAAKIEGIQGIEVVYPYDFHEPEAVVAAIDRLGLGVAAVNVNIKGEPEFTAGSLTSPDPGIRRRAVDLMRQGMDIAHQLGCGRITVCPLSDGHDYAFQTDYRDEWLRMRECFAEAAGHRPDVIVSLEYKPSETRAYSTLAGAYGSALMIKEIGLPNLGVTIDIGHSLYGGECPAQALSMLYHQGIKPYVHLNDNYRNWDWDLMAGAVNLWDLVEFVWTAENLGYDDWYTFDVFPARMDPEACFASSARMLEVVFRIARRIKKEDLMGIRRSVDRSRLVPAITEYVWRAAGFDPAADGGEA